MPRLVRSPKPPFDGASRPGDGGSPEAAVEALARMNAAAAVRRVQRVRRRMLGGRLLLTLGFATVLVLLGLNVAIWSGWLQTAGW